MILRKAAIFFLVGLVVALPSATVFGAIIPTKTLVANPPGTAFIAPDAALAAPWRSYQLSLEATAGELVGAVDVTINGMIHQRWNDTDDDGVTNPSPNGVPSNGRGDSHLTAPTGSPFGAGPTETNSKTGSPLTSSPGVREYGIGGLSGAWAILVPGATTNLAYIVVPQDMEPQIQISVKSADPTGNPFPEFNAAAFGFGGQPTVIPPTVVDVNLGDRIQGNDVAHLFATSAGTTPIVWSNLQITSSPGSLATQPTLTTAGQFNWESHGSPFGSYVFTVTADNTALGAGGGTDTGTLTVNLIIPEPATMSLFGLAMVGLVGIGLRKRS